MRILCTVLLGGLVFIGTAEARLGETYTQSKARFSDLRHFPAEHPNAADLTRDDLNFGDDLTGSARQFEFGPEGKIEVVLWFYRGKAVSIQYFCRPPRMKKFDSGMFAGERPTFERYTFDQVAFDELLKKNLGVSKDDVQQAPQKVEKKFRGTPLEFQELVFPDGSTAMFDQHLIIINSSEIHLLFEEARKRKAKTTKQSLDGL
jgi:hypothetical protein